MRLYNKLLGILIASVAAAAVPACGATGRAHIVATYADPPPPPREEVVRYRPGYVWVHGNWVRDYDGRWRWRSGYYVRERPGYVYVPGRWERRGRHYIWVDGGWRARGDIVIRGRGRF